VPIAVYEADVQPTYPSTFYNSAQIDIPVRPQCLRADYVPNVYVVMRSTLRPSDGSNRVFRSGGSRDRRPETSPNSRSNSTRETTDTDSDQGATDVRRGRHHWRHRFTEGD
jgi:hypothetical protein